MGIIARFALATFALCGTFILGTWLYVVSYSDPDLKPEHDVIVVLSGDYLPTGTLGPQTKARVDRAVTLWQSGIAPILIMSGGTKATGKKSAAELMALRAIQAGVPVDAILIENASHSTLQNALFSSRLIGQGSAHSVLLVTHRYHLPRSWASFHWAGLDHLTLIAADRSSPLLSSELWKEGLKWPVNIVRVGFASGAKLLGIPEESYISFLR